MSYNQIGSLIIAGTLWFGAIALTLAHIGDTLTLILKALEKKDE